LEANKKLLETVSGRSVPDTYDSSLIPLGKTTPKKGNEKKIKKLKIHLKPSDMILYIKISLFKLF
jgi:hypothetical protein